MKRGDPKTLKLERQLNLVSYLLSARAPVPFSDIRGKVIGYDDAATPDAIEKRFDRDKADLRQVGVEIEYITNDSYGRSGYVIDPQNYFLRELQLEPEDAMLIAVLQRTLGLVDDAMGSHLKSALAKLTIDSQLPEPLRTSIGEQHLLSLGRPDKDRARQHLPMLGEAIGRRQRVKFRYHTVDAQRTELRAIRPYGLGLLEGYWHLVGYDEARKAERRFRVDRIQGEVSLVDKDEHAFEVPAGFDIHRHLEQEEFELPDGPEVEVSIELDEVATWLMERRRRGAGRIEPVADGTSIMKVTVRSEAGLFRWLAELGRHARIVEPRRLAAAFAERTQEARALYADVVS